MLPTTATFCYGAITLGIQMTTFEPKPASITGGFGDLHRIFGTIGGTCEAFENSGRLLR
jgi:hypothetical protein